MKGLHAMLMEEKSHLEHVARLAQEGLIGAPEGSLRLSSSHNKVQYYHLCANPERKNGVYIPRGREDFARQLAQKEYNAQVLRLASSRLRQVTTILRDYQDGEVEQIYLEEHPERRKLIQPIEPTWEQKEKSWYEEPYAGKGFSEGMSVILTEKGERVRSKSEKIIADFLNRKGIPYKYECPLVMKGYGTIYPDFTMLSEKLGGEIYLEHEGMMDDPDYAENAIRKINLYEKNGIFPGERLILTFETSKTVLDMSTLEKQLQKCL